MDHAGDIARRIAQGTLAEHGDRVTSLGGDRQQQMLLIHSHEGFLFRVTIEEETLDNLTLEELEA